MMTSNGKKLQIQPAETKVPLTGMAVGAFEVGTARPYIWREVPASTSLVCDEGKLVLLADGGHKECIGIY